MRNDTDEDVNYYNYHNYSYYSDNYSYITYVITYVTYVINYVVVRNNDEDISAVNSSCHSARYTFRAVATVEAEEAAASSVLGRVRQKRQKLSGF